MHSTTKQELDDRAKRLSALSNGTKFSIDYAYGKAKLVKDNKDGSSSDVSDRQTKNELYITIQTILRTLYFMQD